MAKAKILFVDDEPNILQSFQRQLRSQFDLHTAIGARAALQHMERSDSPFSVVIADMKMPEINGIELLQQFHEQSPTTTRIMLTGNVDQDTAVDAVNQGKIFRFLNKPCSSDDLINAIQAGIEQHRLIRAEKELLQKTLTGSVKLLTDILSLIDPDSFGAALDLRSSIREMAPLFGIENSWELELAAMLGPIGAISLPKEVSNKLFSQDELTVSEQSVVNSVPSLSRDLLKNIPRLGRVSEIVFFHFRGFDESGFPQDAPAGTKIPLEARALRIIRTIHKAHALGLQESELIDSLRKDRTLDPALLKLFAEQTQQQLGIAQVIEEQQYEVSASELLPGQTLLKDVLTEDGTLVVRAGHKINEVSIHRIQNYVRLRGLTPTFIVDCRMPSLEQDHNDTKGAL